MPLFCYEGSSIKNQRAMNMDCLLIKEKVIDQKTICLSVVCDGVGSLDAGAYAASSVISLMSEWIDGLVNTDRLGLQLREYVIEINKKIKKEAEEMKINTASTMSALLLDEDKYYITHLGDSRIYKFKDGILTMLTYDHIKNGKLSSCIGHFDDVEVLYDEGIYSKEWFILCSDGLYKKTDLGFLIQELEKLKKRNMKKIVENLIRHAIEQGEKDNISLVVVSKER